jgi:hypothetical protein
MDRTYGEANPVRSESLNLGRKATRHLFSISIFPKEAVESPRILRAATIPSMKPILSSLVASFALLAGVSQAAETTTELERAIRELPPRFVADIPMVERDILIKRLRDSSERRLDLENGFVHFFSDNSRDGISATSMLYMRQFPRTDGGFVVLTHMPKPFAGGSAPRANQTFVFERRKDRWKDVTDEVFPRGIDRTAHFRPRRDLKVVEVRPYLRIERQDGKGEAWQFGPPAAELHWNGEVFLKREPTKDTRSKE